MNEHLRELLGAAAELHTNATRLCDRQHSDTLEACRRSLARLDTILHVYVEKPDEIVKAETVRELVAEVKAQYDRAKETLLETPLTVHIPYEMLREAFDGVVPEK